MIGGPVLILGAVGWVVISGGRRESTDDAYVQAARVAISTSVPGRVVAVEVHENQRVRTGQVLLRLDPNPFAAGAEQAEAELAQARLQVATLKADYRRQVAAEAAARETVAYAEREQARQKDLMTAGVASKQDYDRAVHAADQARAQLETARQSVAAALAALAGDAAVQPERHPEVLRAKAALDRARINLGYTTVPAPQEGVTTRVDQLQVGAYVNQAQPLFWLVSGRPWIEANFKEDQLARMRVGQKATVKIDAYPGQSFAAHVASFAPGTGSTFSVLPAQNATGNWVKVVQRLPVRIEFDRPPPDMASHAGLSAKVTVDVTSGTGR
jgi:membrane fusion protein (multidrug efflux system)